MGDKQGKHAEGKGIEIIMKIGLIDVDGHNYPNLPLMKLSAYHKSQSDEVEWYDPWKGVIERYSRVYMSKVFAFTPDYDRPIYADEIIRGGSGYCIELEDDREVYHAERDHNLPDEIEHIYPDYSIYIYIYSAYGFLTRGCPRGCDFCHVASKEGRCSYKVANLDEFWRGQKEIELLDPNILACPDHKDLLQQLIDSKAKVDFNQGLDVRLITNDNIDLLKAVKLKTVHFAFDRWQDKDIIEPKLRMVAEETGWKRNKVVVYILTNFDTTIEQDLYRIELCRKLNFQPYVMIYDKEHCDGIYKRLQRYANNPYIFWSINSFKEYK